jgi:IS5 family transposase
MEKKSLLSVFLWNEYTPAYPCHSTELVKFRNRIGTKGIEFIFKSTIQLHCKKSEEKEVIVDTIV